MNKCLFCIFDVLISLRNKIHKECFPKSYFNYKNDFIDEDELDELLKENINHPYEENEKVIIYE